MKRHVIGGSLLAAILAFGLVERAEADPFVLDQVAPPPAGGAGGHGDIAQDIAQAQTVTVSITGTLRAVDLFVGRFAGEGFGPLLFDVRPTGGGFPVESDPLALASVAIPPGDVPGFPGGVLRISGLAVPVSAGDALALVLRSPSTVPTPFSIPIYFWQAAGTDYPAGDAFVRAPSLGSPAFRPVDRSAFDDFAFSTFVEPIPEPGTIALVGSGLAFAAMKRARRGGGRKARPV